MTFYNISRGINRLNTCGTAYKGFEEWSRYFYYTSTGNKYTGMWEYDKMM
jgi:hypothetical protein